jgi:hypothetical protein
MTIRRALAALVAASVLSAIAGCGGGGGARHNTSSTERLPASLTLRVRNVAYANLGLEFAQPLGWARSRRGGAILVRSNDRTTAVAISSPTKGDFARLVAADSVRTLLRDYAPARVIARRAGRLGRVPVKTTEIVGATSTGRGIRILSLAAATHWRTYSVQLFSNVRPTLARLAEARALIGSVVLFKPR